MTEEEKIAEDKIKYLAVDLDKTVAKNSAYPEFKLLEPIEGARDALKHLTSIGWDIIIHTSRAWHEESQIKDWLKKWDIPYKRIVCGKYFAKYYVDDRAIHFDNWNEIIRKVGKREN
jgi:hypothetical protein